MPAEILPDLVEHLSDPAQELRRRKFRIDLEQPPAAPPGLLPHAQDVVGGSGGSYQRCTGAVSIGVASVRKGDPVPAEVDEVERDAHPLREVRRLPRFGSAVDVHAVGHDDQGPPSGFGPIQDQGEQDAVVQGRATVGHQPIHAGSQCPQAARGPLKQADTLVEVDQEGSVLGRQRALQERPRHRSELTPYRFHARRRVDCHPQDQRHLAGLLDIFDGLPLAVLDDAEVGGAQSVDRSAAGIHDEDLQVNELDIDLSLERDTFDELGVLQYAAIGEGGGNPDIVIRRQIGCRQISPDGSKAARSARLRRADLAPGEFLVAVEVDPLQDGAPRDRDAGLDLNRGPLGFARGDGADADTKGGIDAIQDETVPAHESAAGTVGAHLQSLLARPLGKVDPGAEGELPYTPEPASVEQEVHAADGPVDDQCLDLDAAREQFMLTAAGRHDAYRRGPGEAAGVAVGGARRGRPGAVPLVDREEPEIRE